MRTGGGSTRPVASAPHGNGVSAAFATANPLTTGNWDSGNPAFTMHTLPNALHRTAAPDFETISRHALVPFPFRGLSRFYGTGKSGK